MSTKNNVDRLLARWAKEYKKGFTGYFILLFLRERTMYGFEISKELLKISDSKLMFQESGIYQILKNLEKNGMVSTEWRKSDKGPRRKYYQIENPGEELLDRFTEGYIMPIISTASKLVEKHFPDLGK